VPEPVSRVLSSSQLATLAEVGEERTAEAGETLYEIGDETYPFRVSQRPLRVKPRRSGIARLRLFSTAARISTRELPGRQRVVYE